MSKVGRPRNQQPQLAYDYRRAITLVQVLAIEDSDTRDKALRLLAQDWLGWIFNKHSDYGNDHITKRLSQHTLEHGRNPAPADVRLEGEL